MLTENIFFILLFFLFGLLFGSFATMASHRLPLGDDMILKPSHCPKCKHRLGFFDLFPLFSWLFNFGKCCYCKKKISIRYPAIELSMGLLFTLIYLKTGISLYSLTMLALIICLVIMIVVDLEHKIIPDSIQIALFFIGITYRYSLDSGWQEYVYSPLLGLATALALRYGFWLWKKREGLGMGDVKFFFVSGLFLNIYIFPVFLLFSGLIGILTAILWKILGKGEEFPFGPALAISMFLCIFIPEYTVDILYGFSSLKLQP